MTLKKLIKNQNGRETLPGKLIKGRRSKSGNGKDCSPGDTISSEFPYIKTTLGGGADVSLSLLSLLDVMSCPVGGAAEIEHLGQTDPQRQELQALVNLWQSLGRPTSPFWRETRVFYNRIVDSYKQNPNV
jgi:hypothetical protein